MVDQVDLAGMQICLAVVQNVDSIFKTATQGYFRRLMPELSKAISNDPEANHEVAVSQVVERFKDKQKGLVNYIDDLGQVLVELLTSETAIPLVLNELIVRLKGNNIVDEDEPKFYESSMRATFLNLMLALCPADIKTVKQYFKQLHPNTSLLEKLIDLCCDINTQTGKISLKDQFKDEAQHNLDVSQLWRRSKPLSTLMEAWCSTEKNQFKVKIRIPRRAFSVLNTSFRAWMKNSEWVPGSILKIGDLLRSLKVRGFTSVGWTRLLLFFGLSWRRRPT